jgi:hypothetical protein
MTPLSATLVANPSTSNFIALDSFPAHPVRSKLRAKTVAKNFDFIRFTP